MDEHASDLELIRRYVRGDTSAFTELLERHSALVYSAALRQTNGRADLAEEVSQATFVLLATRAVRLEADVVVVAWLYRAARYCARDAMKKERRRRYHEARAAEFVGRPTGGVRSNDCWGEVSHLVDDAMESLKERDRVAVLLRFFQGLTIREVATALGTSEPAAAQRVSRAVDRLRQFLARRGVSVPAVALGVTLAEHGVGAAPSHLVGVLASSAASPNAIHFSIAKGALKMMFWTRTKVVAVAAAIVLGVAVLPATVLLSGAKLDGRLVPASAGKAPLFHGALPEGGSLEVCLVDPDGDTNRLWNPDGSVVEPPGIEFVRDTQPPPQSGRRRVSVLIHATDAQGHRTATTFSGGGGLVSFGLSGGTVQKDGKVLDDWAVETVTLNGRTPRFELYIGLQIGQWRTLATWGAGGGAKMLTDDRTFAVEALIPADRDGALIVPLAIQYPKDSDWSERLYAILKDGKRQKASTRLNMRMMNGVGVTSFEFWSDLRMKADDVDRYELETLPMTRLVLRNFPLAPGESPPSNIAAPTVEVRPPHAWPKFKG